MKDAFFETTPPFGFGFSGVGLDRVSARREDAAFLSDLRARPDARFVLIARDIGANLNYIEELIRSLDTQTAQVLIEARIVEATSKYSRDVGIQWGGDVTFGPATGNPTGVAFPSSINAAGGNYDNNTPTAGVDYHAPFGGRKASSYGSREQGELAREFFTIVKTAYVRA